jgi:hypothetical protein
MTSPQVIEAKEKIRLTGSQDEREGIEKALLGFSQNRAPRHKNLENCPPGITFVYT